MPPKRKRNINIMLGCPEDAEIFREYVENAIKNFNIQIGVWSNLELKLLFWKDDTYSTVENAQKAINRQLCEKCDALIAVFYKNMGSANITEHTGTLEEIKYFCRHKKQVFVFVYNGEHSVKPSDNTELKKLNEINNFMGSDKIFHKFYYNGQDLENLVYKNLKNWMGNIKSSSSRRDNHKKKNDLQISMYEHINLCDDWNAIKKYFQFTKKAKQLIDAIQSDGSVQYYIGVQERYRTTPTASVLEALYRAGLLPKQVCYKMQDWVFNSRQDSCDEPGNNSGESGHKPSEEDMPGWSWNEGVSVWATSKALDTLSFTGYYNRNEVINDLDIQETTQNALEWLADQAYHSGGWGFQKVDKNIYPACTENVTMTALALRVITRFLRASDGKRSAKKFSDNLETKLSEAKQKGIDYLLREMVENDKHCYWEYNRQKSLTATIWVLDFINTAGRNEAGNLYKYRNKIIRFCLSELPQNEQEFDDYRDEVYFSGGKTKYKTIKENCKFYSYMPYHIPTLLEAGISPDEKPIVLCIHALIQGKDEYWNGTDKSQGHHQRQSSFVLAMALSVLAIWIKNMAQKELNPKINAEWNIERYDDEKD